jgi:hypothetical protein
VAIWHILCSFGTFFTILVCCTEKNLATLLIESHEFSLNELQVRTMEGKSQGINEITNRTVILEEEKTVHRECIQIGSVIEVWYVETSFTQVSQALFTNTVM